MSRCAILLMGPTGAGKSDIALHLVERLPLEIISVDSALVYRGMDIGTAKPGAAIRERIPHHLIDIRDPGSNYSAGDFVRDARALMLDIWARGRQPLLVGGTMMYFHALTAGIAELPEADQAIRQAINAEARIKGWPAMHAALAAVDPSAAARIHVNDSHRIQRAIEVYRLTGRGITTLQHQRVSMVADAKVIELALAPAAEDRSVLHERIDQRFKAMMAAGFLDEVRALYERGDLTAEHSAMRAVGYKQMWKYMAGEWTLDYAVERAIVTTRQLAKRQFTWLRARPQARWFDSLHQDVASRLAGALSESGVA